MIYNKSNCQTIVRATYKLNNTITIILAGRHAFEYSVTIKRPKSIESMIFPNRNAAIKEINNLKQQYHKFGDVCLRHG